MTTLTDALTDADWSGASIGSKLLITAAIERLRTAEAQVTRLESTLELEREKSRCTEAQLAELRGQALEPVATVDIQHGRPDGKTFAVVYHPAMHNLPDDVYRLYVGPLPPAASQIDRPAVWVRMGDNNHAPDCTLDHDEAREWESRGLEVIRMVRPAASQPVAWRWFDGRGYNSTTDKKQADELVKDGVSVEALSPLQAPSASQPITLEDFSAFAEGMTVSVDVSTGSHDASNRYFGKVTEVVDAGSDDKHGAVILVQDDVKPNFALSQPYTVPDVGEIAVGRLPTMNQDEYPGLGDWWVQLRIGESGDEILARVYGATPQEANQRAESLACRGTMLQPDNSLVVPDGYCIMPLKLTAENGAKGALSGEFHISRDVTCHECGGEGCEDCSDKGNWEEEIPIGWDIIKLIYKAAVDACSIAAAPQHKE